MPAIQRFRNRTDAGRLLARRPGAYAHRADALALALPRGGVPLELANRSAILVDDGVATGSTMLAAIEVARMLHPRTLALAIPVAPDTAAPLAQRVDRMVCLRTPPASHSVGQWYDEFGQTSDEEAKTLLNAAWKAHPAPAAQPDGEKHHDADDEYGS